MGYQPPLSHPVFYNGTAINTQNWQTGTDGVAITRIEGWYDAPDVRDVRELNAGRDGELADNLYLGGRTIIIEGIVTGNTYADLQAKKLALSAKLIPSSTEYVLKLPDADNASPSWTHSSSMADFERVEARVVEGVQFGENDGPLLQSWSVTLRASDPLVYSDTLTTVDSGTSGTAARTAAVTNSGTYASPGSIVVTGPTAADWVVSDSDANTYLQFSSFQLAATTSTATIDLQQRTIQRTQPYKETRLNYTGSWDLLGLWMLNETSGTTADNAEGTAALDGTYTGGFTLNQTGFAAGLPSVDLNGTTGYVNIPYDASLWAYDGSLWEIWFNLDTISGTQCIVDSIASNRGLRFQVNSSAQLVLQLGTGSTTTTTSVYTGIASGTWYHLVYSYAGAATAGKVYLNGVNVYTVPAVSAAYARPSGSTGIRLGATLSPANYLNGKISAFAYWTGIGARPVQLPFASVLNESITDTGTLNAYNKLDFETAEWSSIDTGSSTYTLNSTGLNTGSKLSVQYRSARI